MLIEINKEELLTILRTSRAEHHAIFEEAVNGYKARALEILNEHIERIKAGKRERVQIFLPEPTEHLREYDRAIRMVELHQGDTIELDEQDSAQYVMNDWGWRRDFLTSNASYSIMAAAQAAS